MITISGYNFEGPYPLDKTNFNDVAAVYVILDDLGKKIDVGETDLLKTRLANHERKDCWRRSTNREILVVALLEPNQETRKTIESQIRSSFNFPCGEE